MAQIRKQVPEWCGKAFHRGKEIQLSSAELRGKWYVLYWYPLDFTFVCPTEIQGFQALLGDFQAEGCDVVGVSTDSFFSHQSWFQDREIFADEITHPVIADTNHRLSRAFDVLDEDQGVAFRATAIVDDEGVLRSISVNDLGAGRSPAEVLRTLQALKSGGLCAADWKKGDAFVG